MCIRVQDGALNGKRYRHLDIAWGITNVRHQSVAESEYNIIIF